MTTTPNLGLTLPTVGASRDTWGALLNTNFTTLDTAVSAAMPIGSVIDFAGPSAPAGWLVCDGRLISRATYSDLFAAIGTTWGSGDGSTTFRLPNTPGRASVAAGTVTDSNGNHVVFSLGQTTGAVLQTIQQTHLPSYNLTVSTTGAHTHGGTITTTAVGDHLHTGETAYTGTEGNHQHTVPNTTSGASPTGSFASGAVPFGGPSVTSVDGQHQHILTIDGAGGHAHYVTLASDGSHTHTVALGGGGTALPVLSPVIVFTKIIYAGTQAATTLAAISTPRRELSAPLRGSH
jgi:microcystin-dependent protein